MELLPPDLSARVIIDLDDLEHRKLAYRLRQTGWYRLKPFHVLEYLKFRRLETNLLRTSYEFAVCSAIDRAVLGDAEADRVWVIPNGINLPQAPPEPPTEHRNPTFLFMGSMGYDPNIDGACYFASQIFPLIRSQLPKAQLLIVGHSPVASVSKLHNGDSIVVTGGVPDVGPYLEQATAVVVPIRFGGGTRIKILEAMAHARPVVSTTIGAEGLETEPNVHFLQCDDPQEFATACVMLWRDPQLCADLTRKAYQLVGERYTWDNISARIHEILAERWVRPGVSA
jgi:glycosyltransferase involved in cell wall biosynthesis